MFHIGDKIFYPLHGVGVVELLKRKKSLEKAQYYILHMTLRNLQVMIPITKTANSKKREVVDLDVLENSVSSGEICFNCIACFSIIPKSIYK